MAFKNTGSESRRPGEPSKAVRRMRARLASRGYAEIGGKVIDITSIPGYKRPGSQNRRKH